MIVIIFISFLLIITLILLLWYSPFIILYFKKKPSISAAERIAIMKEMLQSIVQSVHKEDETIPIWLQYGTLLGYIRQGDFICWDYDIDLATWLPHFKAVERALKTLRGAESKYIVFTWNIGPLKQIVVAHVESGLHTDFAFYCKNENKQIVTRCLLPISSQKDCEEKTPLNWYEPLSPIIFHNVGIYIPRNYHGILTCYYGDNYLTPDKVCDKNCLNCVKNPI
jgi:hypothetical protein